MLIEPSIFKKKTLPDTNEGYLINSEFHVTSMPITELIAGFNWKPL
jgi:hypothetical protein